MSGLHVVLGASGFLGSHVARELVARGERVRAVVRPSSDTRAIDDLDLEVRHGDIFDLDSVRRALEGAEVVYYCVVDTRSWLRDPAPLQRTNVDGLRGVLEAARGYDLRRFVFTSSVATLPIDRRPGHLIDEDAGPHNWLAKGGPYVRSRVDAEALALDYARTRGLPLVAMCVANTYGARDLQPTPHGQLVKAASRGRLGFYIPGAGAEVVDIADAARALVLAGERGRIGERYVVAERYLSMREVHEIAAAATGAQAPRYPLPATALLAVGAAAELYGRLRHREVRLTRTSVRLMSTMTPLDHSKAVCELGWDPRPAGEAIHEAALDFARRRRARRSS